MFENLNIDDIVVSSEYGQGVITDITNGFFKVSYQNDKIIMWYSLENGFKVVRGSCIDSPEEVVLNNENSITMAFTNNNTEWYRNPRALNKPTWFSEDGIHWEIGLFKGFIERCKYSVFYEDFVDCFSDGFNVWLYAKPVVAEDLF